MKDQIGKNKGQIKVRKAVVEDCPAMMELIRELAIYEKEPEAVTVSQDHFRDSGFGPNPVWWAFVAEMEDKTISGFALYYIRYSTWKGQRMYLEDIIVSEAYRGNGIGMLLMQVLVKEATDRSLCGITWQVLNWNEPAINFYKKLDARFDEGWMNVSIEVKG